MKGDGRNSARFERLMQIAHDAGVQVEFLPAAQFPGLNWDGLYLVTNSWGSGIAIRDGLSVEWRDWILAHELGHHFTPTPRRLFSPFYVDAKPAMNAGWKIRARVEPEEEAADSWAARTLISDALWESAEAESPCDLAGIVSRLELPPPAAVAWERAQRLRHRGVSAVRLRIDRHAFDTIAGRVTGSGGHQSFFRRLLATYCRKTVALSFVDFSLARERVLSVGGGWRQRYGTLLAAVEPQITSAGGVQHFFGIGP